MTEIIYSNTNGRDILTVTDAELIFSNFCGAPDKFNPKGSDKGHTNIIVTNPDTLDMLRSLKVRLKPLKKRDPEDPQAYTFKAILNFGGAYLPRVRTFVGYDNTGCPVYNELLDPNHNRLADLDNPYIRVNRWDLTLSVYNKPYDYNGEEYRSCYINDLLAGVEPDTLGSIYEENAPAVAPGVGDSVTEELPFN